MYFNMYDRLINPVIVIVTLITSNKITISLCLTFILRLQKVVLDYFKQGFIILAAEL